LQTSWFSGAADGVAVGEALGEVVGVGLGDGEALGEADVVGDGAAFDPTCSVVQFATATIEPQIAATRTSMMSREVR
jgi:hypothetical protein